jgi:hypothetical protein
VGAACYHCNGELQLLKIGSNISRKEDCPSCGRDLHVCKMCVYYDTRSYNECKEPVAQRIVDKEKSNFCDNYRLTDKVSDAYEKDNVLSAADALFKK